MAMLQEADDTSDSPSNRQRQRSSTPTASTTNWPHDGLPSTVIKSTMQEPSEQQLDAYAAPFSSSNRQDLIQRLKRSQSPTWQRNVSMNPFYKPYIAKENSSPTALLPAIDLPRKDDFTESNSIHEQKSQGSMKLALHSGNFANDIIKSSQCPTDFPGDTAHIERPDVSPTSPTSLWYKALPSSIEDSKFCASPSIDIPNSHRTPARLRAPSLSSFSPKFDFRPPTSPLAQETVHNEREYSPIDLEASPTKSNRRHTMPPNGFNARTTAHSMTLAQAARQPPSMQRERSLPYQTHHARRSYSGLSFPSSPSPSTPNFLRSRRSSFASDASPIQASMVGSYEESILRGRMSTTPSKPLDFTAHIGALGKSDCKPKYPAHVSVEFPAVYYSWNISNGGSISDEPSPYVGQIDLEHKLNGSLSREKSRKRREAPIENNALSESSVRSREAKRNEKRRRRSQSPHNSLQSFGGCYRIPQQGQLQVLIKNPNKTAVKLFLIPYDLEGMQSGTKTFVRQRSYSAGPIIEKPLTSRSFSDSIIETNQKPAENKPILRYLIQLNICCPAQGRFYLYKSIQVVFANRVPDDKEKLKTDILWPEPKYSMWKPSTMDSGASTPAGSQTNNMDLDRKRRSYGLNTAMGDIDTIDGLSAYTGFPLTKGVPVNPNNETKGYDSVKQDSKLAFRDINASIYTKLNPGDSGYGGRPTTPDSESLLAKRLKGLSNNDNKNQAFEILVDIDMA